MAILEISGLTKTYASGVEALKRIDLSIERGEIFALLGPNGAGKTTLISIVCGIATPSSGAIRVDGHDLRSLPLSNVPTNWTSWSSASESVATSASGFRIRSPCRP